MTSRHTVPSTHSKSTKPALHQYQIHTASVPNPHSNSTVLLLTFLLPTVALWPILPDLSTTSEIPSLPHYATSMLEQINQGKQQEDQPIHCLISSCTQCSFSFAQRTCNILAPESISIPQKLNAQVGLCVLCAVIGSPSLSYTLSVTALAFSHSFVPGASNGRKSTK